ncbi:helicase HerA-like domain-containing protein [Demequina sp.]|uniref:helicase HerA-like domain-containing protein n=1 Tax=Demequina sp. TaxID=2050685 RepID=UPI0025E56584|nr:helicase HerA-like domain-containing protein [Demequina sp.]
MSDTTSDPFSAAYASTVAAGYTFEGGSIALGALVQGEDANADAQVRLPLAMMNRHGLIAGATGTGKTRTLQGMAEALSDAGVPVFVTDVKGDLSGMALPGEPKGFIDKRAADIGQDWAPRGYPMEFYSIGGAADGVGIPMRTTVTDFGPLLLAKVLGLTDIQESALGLVFHWADTNGLALLDLKDLRAVIQHLTSDEGKAELTSIGGVSSQTAGVLLREIANLQAQGADAFFGEPAYETSDLLRTTPDGRGVISALELPNLVTRPRLFSTFLMWLLADLFADLPEVGDADKPRLVFFFDEAHLLFDDASKEFLTQVTQTVRLIRSKGVGIFFCTQTPKDLPADVLGQLGSRIQHALRAFTPDDATAMKATARTFPNSPYDLEEVLTTMGIGEAVVTVLSDKGAPTPVAWTRLCAPRGLMDPAPAGVIASTIAGSPLSARYGTMLDRESAYELLGARAEKAAAAAQEREAAEEAAAEREREQRDDARSTSRTPSRSRSRARDKSVTEQVLGSAPVRDFARTAGREIGRSILRSVFGVRSR